MLADALPPVVPAFEFTVSSQGMSKGVLQSDGPQFIPRASLKMGRLQLGGQWKNLSTNSANGEGSLFGGWNGKAGKVDLGASVTYKFLTAASGSGNRTTWEFAGNVGRKFGKLGLRASTVYSPDDFGGTKSSFYVEGGASYDLSWKLKASAAIGFRERKGNRDYTAYNIGLARPIGKKLTVDMRYYDTDSGEYGENFDNRIVGSIKLAL